MLLWLFNYNDRICERGRKGLSRGEFSPRGMEPPRPGRMPRRRRRVILVIAVSAIVVVAGFLIWDVFVRPRSLAEVYGFDHWSPGSAVTVVGTITSIERQSTSYGPEVYLGLDGGPGCAGVPSVVGDPTAKYEIGAPFQTTLHFQRYTINGDPAVSAPELHCPFPSTLRAIGTVLDAGRRHAGPRWRPASHETARFGSWTRTTTDSWTTATVWTSTWPPRARRPRGTRISSSSAASSRRRRRTWPARVSS